MWSFTRLRIGTAKTTAVLHCAVKWLHWSIWQNIHSSTRASEGHHQHNLCNSNLPTVWTINHDGINESMSGKYSDIFILLYMWLDIVFDLGYCNVCFQNSSNVSDLTFNNTEIPKNQATWHQLYNFPNAYYLKTHAFWVVRWHEHIQVLSMGTLPILPIHLPFIYWNCQQIPLNDDRIPFIFWSEAECYLLSTLRSFVTTRNSFK